MKLYQFPPSLNIWNVSPFCLKLEAFLVLSEIDYEVTDLVDLSSAPKGKGPYIELDGEKIGDSNLIIDILTKKHDITFGTPLTDSEKAISTAFRAMVEEHLYWVMVYSRWAIDKNWAVINDLFFGKIPDAGMRDKIAAEAREYVLQNIYSQGLGRHSQEEIFEFARKDISAIANWLSDKDYFFGPNIKLIDLCVYSLLANLLIDELSSPLTEMVKSHENLLNYCKRIEGLLNRKREENRLKKVA